MSLGRRIRTLRKNNSFTQQNLADAVGVSRIYIQALESNRRMPSMKLLYKLADALKASITDIVDDFSAKTARIQLEDFFSSGELDFWYRKRKLSEKELRMVEKIVSAVFDELDQEDDGRKAPKRGRPEKNPPRDRQ
jgi:transcriptional regulator with XRE-family HTH domain